MGLSITERNPVTIGIASLIGLGIIAALAFSLNRIPFIARNYVLHAEFADAAGLAPENEVRVAGIKVGRVSDVALRKDRVIVTMEIDDGVEIPQNSTAAIGLKTILGTKYVAINARAEGKPLPEGATIPLLRTSIPFEIYQSTNAAVELLEGIDAEALNEGFRALEELTLDPDRDLARTLKGTGDVAKAIASEDEALRALVKRGDEVLGVLDESSPEIQALISNSNQLLEILARRRAVVQSLLRNTDLLASQLGGLLEDNQEEIKTILEELNTILKIVDSQLGQLEEAVRLLGPSSESLSRLVWTGRWANICIYAIEGVAGTPNSPNPNPVDCAP